MKTIGSILVLLVGFSLHGQSSLISFTDLKEEKDPAGTPVYYFEGQVFSGKTYDYHEQENVSLEHYLEKGLLRLKEGFRNNKKIEHAEFKDGLLDGVYLKYFGNGQKYVEHHYLAGRMHGKQFGWKKDGSLRFVANYKHGLEIMRMDYPPPGGFDTMIKN